MTDLTISVEKIKATKTYCSLNKIQQEFIIKRENRKLITNALIVHRNTSIIPANVFGYNLMVLEDLILGESAKIN